MAYTKQNFTSGQTLKAEHLNNMEAGIVANEKAIVEKRPNHNIRTVNHRGFSTAPENTIPAYILSKQNGYRYVECDVSFTLDGVAVLLHDSTIDRTSNGTGEITSMTYKQALRYDFGNWKGEEYTGTRIPTFEEFLLTCKGLGLHPYIELKTGAYTEDQILTIVNTVKSTGMKGLVTYISFNPTYLKYVRNAVNDARLGLVVDSITSDTLVVAGQTLKTEANEVFVDASYYKLTDETVQMCIDAGVPLEVYTVNNPDKIVELHPYVTGITTDSQNVEQILYDKYIVYTAPKIEDIPDPDAFAVETIATNAKNSNGASYVIRGSSYVATLTGDNGYNIGGGYVTVTMGGEDVTAACYADGTVNIPSVTGDISISAEAVLEAPAAPEGYETVKTLYSNDIMYGYCAVNTAPKTTPPYTGKMSSRAGYFWNDIPLEYGYKYRVDFNAKKTTAQMGLQQFTSKAMEYFNNATPTTTDTTNIQTYLSDPGWKSSGYEWEVAEQYAGYPITNLRINFRIDTSNSAVTEGDIQSVTVSRIKV